MVNGRDTQKRNMTANDQGSLKHVSIFDQSQELIYSFITINKNWVIKKNQHIQLRRKKNPIVRK